MQSQWFWADVSQEGHGPKGSSEYENADVNRYLGRDQSVKWCHNVNSATTHGEPAGAPELESATAVILVSWAAAISDCFPFLECPVMQTPRLMSANLNANARLARTVNEHVFHIRLRENVVQCPRSEPCSTSNETPRRLATSSCQILKSMFGSRCEPQGMPIEIHPFDRCYPPQGKSRLRSLVEAQLNPSAGDLTGS